MAFLKIDSKWWVRLCVKAIDYGIFFLVGTAISLFFPCYLNYLFYLVFAVCVPVLWIPVEALLISIWGTTIGNAILGFEVLWQKGKMLSYKEALQWSISFQAKEDFLVRKPIRSWRFVVGAALALSCLLGAVFSGKIIDYTLLSIEQSMSIDGWIKYSSEAGFKVAFPAEPKVEENKTLEVPNHDKTLNYSELTSQTKKAHYSVSYMQLPRKWRLAGNSTLLKGALELIVKNSPSTTLLEKNFVKHNNLRVLDFHMQQGEEMVQGRLIIVGGTLFKLMVSYPPSIAADLKHEIFLDSFEIDP